MLVPQWVECWERSMEGMVMGTLPGGSSLLLHPLPRCVPMPWACCTNVGLSKPHGQMQTCWVFIATKPSLTPSPCQDEEDAQDTDEAAVLPLQLVWGIKRREKLEAAREATGTQKTGKTESCV